MKTRSLLFCFSLASLAIAADVFKIKTNYKNTELYLHVDLKTDEVCLRAQEGENFELSDNSHLVISKDNSYVIAHEENDLIQANKVNSEISFSTWKINENEISYEFPLYACLHLSSYSVTVNPKIFANHEVDCFLIEQLNVEKEKRDSEKFNSFKTPKSAIHEFPKFNLRADILSNFLKYASEPILQKLTPNNDDNNVGVYNSKAGSDHYLTKRNTITLNPANPMVITGQYQNNEVVIAIHNSELVIIEEDYFDAAKFTLNNGMLVNHDNYVEISDGFLILSTEAPTTALWTITDNKLYFGEDPVLVQFYGCTDGKVSIDSSSGCVEITEIKIENFEFEQQDNENVVPEKPMAISGTLEGGNVFISTQGNDVTVFTGDLIDATKFTISGRYLKAGNKYVAVNGGDGKLGVVSSVEDSSSGWILSGDKLYFGDDPKLVHFYKCTDGKVSIQSGEGCEEITEIEIENFGFEQQNNKNVVPEKPMAISGIFDADNVFISTQGNDVTVFTGDLIDATKFTISGRYLMAGGKYVAVSGDDGKLSLVEKADLASFYWVISDDKLYFGDDPKLVHFYKCTDGKVSIQSGEGCEEITEIEIENFGFEQQNNKNVVPEKPMAISGIFDADNVFISTQGNDVTVFTGDLIDATKFTISGRYLMAGGKYVAVSGDDGKLSLVEKADLASFYWVISDDKLYFGDDPKLVHFYKCTDGKVSIQSGEGCEEITEIEIENFGFEQQNNENVVPEKPMAISGIFDADNVFISTQGNDVTVFTGDLIDATKFTISGRYLMAGGKYVAVSGDDGKLSLVEKADLASFYWVISDDKLYFGDDPKLVHFYKCTDGKVSIQSGEGCEEITEIEIENFGFEQQNNENVVPEKPMAISGIFDADNVFISTQGNDVTVFTGDLIDATKFTISGRYLMAGGKYVAVNGGDGKLGVVSSVEDSSSGWILSGDKLYFGDDPKLVHFYKCTDGKVSIQSGEGCEEITEIEIENFGFEQQNNENVVPEKPMAISGIFDADNVFISTQGNDVTVFTGDLIDATKFTISGRYLMAGGKYVAVSGDDGKLSLVEKADLASFYWVISDDKLYFGDDPKLVHFYKCTDGKVSIQSGEGCEEITEIEIENFGFEQQNNKNVVPEKPMAISGIFDADNVFISTQGNDVTVFTGDLIDATKFTISGRYLMAGGKYVAVSGDDGKLSLVEKADLASFYWVISDDKLYFGDDPKLVHFYKCTDGKVSIQSGEGCEEITEIEIENFGFEQQNNENVVPEKPMAISGIFDADNVFISTQGNDVTVFTGDLIDATKFTISGRYLMAGGKYVAVSGDDGKLSLVEKADLASFYWVISDDKLYFGDDPKLVHFYKCTDGKVSIQSGEGCEEITEIEIENFGFEQQNNENVVPEKPMAISGIFDADNVFISTQGNDVTVFTGDLIDATKFTISGRYLMAGGKYVAVSGDDGKLSLVEKADLASFYWVISDDKLYFGDDPKLVHFYKCTDGKVSIQSGEGCEEITEIEIENFGFEQQNNKNVVPEKPMAISGIFDADNVFISTQGNDVTVFTGDLIDATKFTISGRYLMAGGKYVAVSGDDGKLSLVEKADLASFYWVISDDKLYFGDDPKLVHFYKCTDGKVSIQSGEGCEEITEIEIENFGFEQQNNENVVPEKPMAISGIFDADNVFISTQGNDVTVFTGDLIDATKFTISGRYLMAGGKYVAVSGDDGKLSLVEKADLASFYWVISDDKLYFGDDPKLVHFYKCTDGKVSIQSGEGCEEITEIEIENFGFEQQNNENVVPEKPMAISGIFDADNVFISTQGNDVTVFTGDLIDATKFTISGRYLMAGGKYVAVNGGDGKLGVVSSVEDSSSGWILSGDKLYFGDDPKLVHFYKCTDGKVSIQSGEGCEEITEIEIENFGFEQQNNENVVPEKPMAISGIFDADNVFISTQGNDVTVFTGDLIDATKFTISGRYLMAGGKYVAVNGGDGKLGVVSSVEDSSSGWILSGDKLYFGDDPKLVHFYKCTDGKVSIQSGEGCEEITEIEIENFGFEQQNNENVVPEKPMAISGIFDADNVFISTQGNDVTVFTGDLIDATKFTISGRYLKAGNKYVAVNGGDGKLGVVSSVEDSSSGWILSGDKLYFGDDPKLVHFYKCTDGKVSIQSGEGCEEITEIEIENFGFEQQNNENVVPEKPMAISGIFDADNVFISTQGNDVTVFTGDLIDATKFTISGRYLMAGGKYVAVSGDDGKLSLVEKADLASFYWVISDDKLYFGDDPKLVHFYKCTDGKVSIQSGEGCEEITEIEIENFGFEQQNNKNVVPEKPMAISGIFDADNVFISTQGNDVTVFTGDLIDATKFTISGRYLMAGGKYVAVSGDDGKLSLVEKADLASFYWVISDDKLYFGDDPKLVHFYKCTDGKVSIQSGEGCEEITEIEIENFGFEQQNNENVVPEKPMAISGIFDADNVFISTQGNDVTVFTGDLIDATKFTISGRYLMAGGKYVAVSGDDGKLSLVEKADLASFYWVISDDKLYFGDDPKLVHFYKCTDGKVSIQSGEGCEEITEIEIENFGFEQQNNENVVPEKPMAISGIFDADNVFISTQGNDVTVFTGDLIDATKFTISGRYLMAGGKYVAVNGGDGKLGVVSSVEDSSSGWILSGDKLYFGDDPKLVHFYKCTDGKVSIQSGEGCEEITEIEIENFGFEQQNNENVVPEKPMAISGIFDADNVFISTQGNDVTVFTGDLIDATKFTISGRYLMAGGKYVAVNGGDGKLGVVSSVEDSSSGWILSGDKLYFGDDPKLVHFYKCTDGKVSIQSGEGCEEITEIEIENFGFEQQNNKNVVPEKPMAISGIFDADNVFISTQGNDVTVFTGDLIDATKFTISGRYLMAGGKYVAVSGDDGKLSLVEKADLASFYWVISDDKLYFGDDPKLVHFYKCTDGKVSIQSGEGCEEITEIEIENFGFEQQNNENVVPEKPMAISGIFDADNVFISTQGNDVTVFTGDLIDATKFTISGRYLMAGGKYVAVNGGDGKLGVVSSVEDSSSGWILSGDKLYFGDDPKLVHFYKCTDGKVSIQSGEGCEEITEIEIENFGFEQQNNENVVPEKPMAISGIFDADNVFISTQGNDVTVFTGDLIDATKFTISGRYLKAGNKYVAVNGGDGKLGVVSSVEDSSSGWILSGDKLYFGDDPKLVHFYKCTDGKVSIQSGEGCEEITEIEIENFGFEQQNNENVVPEKPMAISGIFDADNVFISTQGNDVTVFTGDLIDATKFTISGRYLMAGGKYVAVNGGDGKLGVVSSVEDSSSGWILSGDKLYFGDDPKLVHFYKCTDGKVSIDSSSGCDEITEIKIENVGSEPSTESSESSYESSELSSASSDELESSVESSIELSSVESDVTTGEVSGSTTESATESDTDSVIETDSETVFTSETYSSNSSVEPEPTSPLIDPLEPFTVEVMLENEELELLTDGVYITLEHGILASFKIDEEYLMVGMNSWISVDESGLMVLVDDKSDAAIGWRIYDNQLYYEASQGILRRDSEDSVVFSACEQQGAGLVVYIGDIFGCEPLDIVSLDNHNSSDDPIPSFSSDLSSEMSFPSSEESYSSITTEPSPDSNSTTTQSDEPSVTSSSESVSSTMDPPSSVDPSDETLDESSSVDLTTILSTTEYTSDSGLISSTTTFSSESTSDSISGAVISTTTLCEDNGNCSEIVVTVTPGGKTASVTNCDPDGICDEDISTTKEFSITTITSSTTITVTTCVDSTNCQTGTQIISTVYTTYCQTTATVSKSSIKSSGSSASTFTSYTSKNTKSETSTTHAAAASTQASVTYAAVTTHASTIRNSISKVSSTIVTSVSSKSTVTITVCSENNQCEEIVSIIASSDTLHSYPSSVAVMESGNYYSEDHQLSTASVSAEDLSSTRILNDSTFVKSPMMVIWLLISLHLLA